MTEVTNDMFALPCVVMSESMTSKGKTKADCVRQANLNAIVLELVKLKPNWTFCIVESGYNSWSVDALENGEPLGNISYKWHGRDMVYSISNRRIRKERSRSSAYHTKDMKKALAAIKKTFSLNSVAERVALAESAAYDVLRQEFMNKRSKHHQFNNVMQKHAVTFLKAVQAEFHAWLREQGHHQVIDDYEQTAAEMLTVETAYTKFQNHKTALVIRCEGQYIVKLRDKLEILDDTRLPDWLKAKVGMLKLVNDESFITGVGCRANAECFVVLADGEGEQL